MNDIIQELNKGITNYGTREYLEAKVAKNINEAVSTPAFYNLGLDVLTEILDKSDAIDNNSITTIINSGFRHFGCKASVLLPHIKCRNLRRLVNNFDAANEGENEIEKEIKKILDVLDFIPIIHEVKRAILELIEKYRSALRERAIKRERVIKSESEEGEFDVDWEEEYKNAKAKIEVLEKRISNTKQIFKIESQEKILEKEEIERIENVVNKKDMNGMIEILSKDISIINGDILSWLARFNWKEGVEFIIDTFFLSENYINRKDYDGFTALMYASQRGHIEVVESLVNRGADIEATDNNKGTALMHASHWGHSKVVKYLVSKGANIEAKDENGQTALLHASFRGRLKIVKYLVSKGANIEAKDEYGQTPLICASNFGCLDTVRYLIKKGANTENYDPRTRY